MTDHFPRRQAQPIIGISLNDLATNAVVDAVDAVMPPNRLRNPREGSYDDVIAASEHNDREARPAAAEIMQLLDDRLQRSGLAFFDHCFLANPRNAAMHTAYRAARALHSDDLDAALERAWGVRRRDWDVRAAIPGHPVHPDDGEVAMVAPSGWFVGLKAKIRAFLVHNKGTR